MANNNEIERRRTFAIIAHPDAGKTSLTEKLLLKGDGHDDAYYAALRKWKAETDYDMAWGWFGGWGANATNLKNSLRGLPDSLYLAAIWGRWRPSVLTDAMKADMEYVQRVKGTKVVCTTITGWVGVDVIGGDYLTKLTNYIYSRYTLSTFYLPDTKQLPILIQ